VRIVVGFGAGGGTDIAARAIAVKLSDVFNTSFVVDNRPGAAGNLAGDIVAKSNPDGYTMLMANSTIAIPSLSANLPFDIRKDFTPLSLVALGPSVLVVHPTVPASTVKDLVALAKEMFKRLAGVNMTTVPYKGNALSITDVMGGHIVCMFSDALPAMTNMRSGKLRALAVTSETRWPPTPELPTLAETGIKGFAAVNWWGIVTPAGVPRPIIDKLNGGVVKAVATPSVKARLSELGVETVSSTPEEFAAFMAAEAERWGKLVRETNMKGD